MLAFAPTPRILLPLIAFVVPVACARPGPTPWNQPPVFAPDEPEGRAVAYLRDHAARWRRENGCFSCHNNGDAARALMVAGTPPADVALAETLEFLRDPRLWDANSKGDPAASDKKLARVQFAGALVTAHRLGYATSSDAVERAARLVADAQAPDGSWQLGSSDLVGSPATYGHFLGTSIAVQILRHAESDELRLHVERGERWLRSADARNVLDAAGVLMHLGSQRGVDVGAQTKKCLELIRRGQGTSGGWGPFVNSPPQVFDTAVVLIALARLETTAEWRARIARGRAFLVATQEAGGGWPETTRPSGFESYAQHISTTGWATLALLATRGGETRDG